MGDIVRRGFVDTDNKEFNDSNILLLKKAQEEILYLLERGYPIKSASTYVGNHYLLSERQRLAIVRATSEKSIIDKRLSKCIDIQSGRLAGEVVFIDGLNLIITLEVALSGSTLIKCMDGTIRDLAGLRGTYRLIDKTDEAIQLICNELAALNISKATFFLDAPVSNTGRLKQKIYDMLSGYPFQIAVELVNNADTVLEKLNNVITSDAIILNECRSYINLAAEIIEKRLPEIKYIDLSHAES